MQELAWRIASTYPSAELFTAHPRGKRAPEDLSIYADRVVKPLRDVADVPPPSGRPQILMLLQRHDQPPPAPPAGWRKLDEAKRDRNTWHAFVRQ